MTTAAGGRPMQIGRLRAAERAPIGVDEPVGHDGGGTLAELLAIGARLGVSAERVRQVECAALEKLRERSSG